MTKNLRNIAIIAHVDHGKTTLIDQLLQQSGMLDDYHNQVEHIMDYNILEKERGITIFAKHATINWENYYINIIDTPGHADFSGEVERIMSMVDSVLLLVDASEGPMPQTSFVTKTAFTYGLKPIVIINKIDQPNARPNWVINHVFDLFISLGATDEQLDFPIIYTSGLKGISGISYQHMTNNMIPLLESIIKYAPAPNNDVNGAFQMQISQLDYNNYVGSIGIGRITRGVIRPNQNITIINKNGVKRNGRITKIFNYKGLHRISTELAKAGNIIAIAGLDNLNISDTLCEPSQIEALRPLVVNEPTISMLFSVNTSPFCGREGKFITSRCILQRLHKELLYNVSLCVEETNNPNIFRVSGRGELHLAVLIESMRREGFEMAISRPKVIFRTIDGIKQEPFESLILYIQEEHIGPVIKAINLRKGKMRNMLSDNKKLVRLDYIIPSRGLIGFRNEFLIITSGMGTLFASFSHYDDMLPDEIRQRHNGVLISNSHGKSLAYALYSLQERGRLFIGHGVEVYKKQIIGIHNRSNDLIVNCISGKKLTNMRAANADEATILIPAINMTLEQSLEFINDDELVEVTPKSIRLHKLLN